MPASTPSSGLVPRDFDPDALRRLQALILRSPWDAINELLAWKLEGAEASSLKLSDDDIGRSVVAHLRPILFEDDHGVAGAALPGCVPFTSLVAAQIELNEFVEVCECLQLRRQHLGLCGRATALRSVEVDPGARRPGSETGGKLERLHGYRLHRAMDAFVAYVVADPGRWAIGRPENGDANRLAWSFEPCRRSFVCVRCTVWPTPWRPGWRSTGRSLSRPRCR